MATSLRSRNKQATRSGGTEVLEDIQPDRFGGPAMSDSNDGRTAGYANYLFADGHVETIPAAEIKRRCDARDNFARPAD